MHGGAQWALNMKYTNECLAKSTPYYDMALLHAGDAPAVGEIAA